MIEIWKKIKECNYEASNLGRIRNMLTGHILKPSKNPKGYYMVDIGGKRNRKYVTVHKIIAECFLVKQDASKSQVNHIDGNKLNNSVENLEYCTPKQNVLHSISLGLVPNKLSDTEVIELVKLFNIGENKKEIAKRFNISLSVLNGVLTGKTYSHSSGIKYNKIGKREVVEKYSKLTEDKAIEIRKELSRGELMAKEIAYKYGVSPATISEIKHNKIWNFKTE